VLLAHASRPELLLLEGTAAAAWRLLEEPRTPAGLAEELARAFGARAAEIRTTLDPFLADLRARGLVQAESREERSGG
ncbi:MAG TPA: PqqD family protein, partial [Actinomycetota bacterium]|nr:PqqD family protein [Actinomycetota bacterium]